MLQSRRALLICGLSFLIQGLCIAQNPTPLEKGAQKPVEGSQPASTGGVSTGRAAPVVLDAQHRPITAEASSSQVL